MIGCSALKPVEIKKTEIKLQTPIRKPSPLVLKQVKWKIIQENETIYIALTTSDYDNLSYNLLQLRKYIEEQNLILESLRENEKF